MFNNVFFPGIVTTHFTLGGGVKLSKSLALDAAIVYAPEVSKTVNTGAISGYMGYKKTNNAAYLNNPADASTAKTTHSQVGYTVSLRMNF